jgi:hypothetical protein
VRLREDGRPTSWGHAASEVDENQKLHGRGNADVIRGSDLRQAFFLAEVIFLKSQPNV